MITSDDDRWIRGVAALEPTFVRNDQAAVALTWLAASPDDVELCLEVRHHPSITPREPDPFVDPSAMLLFADGTRLGMQDVHSAGTAGGSRWFQLELVYEPLPDADLVAVELAWRALDLAETFALEPQLLRDAAARAVPRG